MKKLAITITILALISFSCDKCDLPAQNPVNQPEFINDGLETGTLEEVNLKSGCIGSAIDDIRSKRYTEVHSMLIYRNNKIVVEEYFDGHRYQWDQPGHHGEYINWNRDEIHDVCSVAKSFTSALIGIAVDKGFIESVHNSIFDYLPDHQHLKSEGREDITIEHLLTMTAGLYWPEWSAPYSSADNPVIGVWLRNDTDPISYILRMPLVDVPGEKYNYSTGNMTVLGEIIRNSSGLSMNEFSGEYLFGPLDVENYNWHTQFDDGVDSNQLKTTPRAMMKFGVTFLNNGFWNGERIISSDWVEQSSKPYKGNININIPGEASGRMGYSYSWWTKTYKHNGKEINLYSASGFGGQHIMVLPEVDMVIVFTSGNFISRRPNFKILEKYIIPAIQD